MEVARNQKGQFIRTIPSQETVDLREKIEEDYQKAINKIDRDYAREQRTFKYMNWLLLVMMSVLTGYWIGIVLTKIF